MISGKQAIIIVGILAVAILGVLYLTDMPIKVVPTALEPTFCTPLAVWWGEVKTVTEKDCAAWESSFNCELRRGGGMGVVASQVLTSTCQPTVEVPGTGQCGNAVDVCWDTTVLEIGDYEIFARLEQTNGVETWYGALQGAEGHDGNMFFLVDQFTVGQVCNVPGQFVIVQ